MPFEPKMWTLIFNYVLHLEHCDILVAQGTEVFIGNYLFDNRVRTNSAPLIPKVVDVRSVLNVFLVGVCCCSAHTL